MEFADLIAPVAEHDFLDTYWDRKPLHIPAAASRSVPLRWDDLNALLAQRTPWTANRFKLILNSRPVDAAHYMTDLPGRGEVGDPARIEHLLAIGASLVLDHVEDLLPSVRALTDMLASRFAASANANCYASFKGVQAFASHYDTHEVFAIQCHGEKRWRIYANRAESPLEAPQGDDAQAWIDGAKGPVAFDIVMRPGDVLYIPRGYFHDAIATASDSLHLTLGVAPHSGRLLLQLMQDMALSDSAFRAYLPDARAEGGTTLQQTLADLGERLATLAAGKAMLDAVTLRQRMLHQPAHSVTLPSRPQLSFFARTARRAQVEHDGNGAWLAASGQRQPLELLADAAQWMASRPAFSLEEVYAQFPWHPTTELRTLVDRFRQLGLIEPYQPKV